MQAHTAKSAEITDTQADVIQPLVLPMSDALPPIDEEDAVKDVNPVVATLSCVPEPVPAFPSSAPSCVSAKDDAGFKWGVRVL